MKRHFYFLIFFFFLRCYCHAQVRDEEIKLLQKLDSVSHSQSIAAHFAELYFNTTVRIANTFLNVEEKAHTLMQRMETRFAELFLRAAEAYRDGLAVPEEWKNYYDTDHRSVLQYQLLGINAHINGDIWQALTQEFSFGELRSFDKYFFLLKKALLEVYKEFYSTASRHRAIRNLHVFSLGLDKLYGRLMLGHWRHRQYKIARLYYTDKQQMQKKLVKLQHKMKILDRLILRYL